jgi:hypothetical protein
MIPEQRPTGRSCLEKNQDLCSNKTVKDHRTLTNRARPINLLPSFGRFGSENTKGLNSKMENGLDPGLQCTRARALSVPPAKLDWTSAPFNPSVYSSTGFLQFDTSLYTPNDIGMRLSTPSTESGKDYI